jgi:hypothetical protein
MKACTRKASLAIHMPLFLNTQLPQDDPFEVVKKYPGSTFIVRILSAVGEKPQKPLQTQN